VMVADWKARPRAGVPSTVGTLTQQGLRKTPDLPPGKKAPRHFVPRALGAPLSSLKIKLKLNSSAFVAYAWQASPASSLNIHR